MVNMIACDDEDYIILVIIIRFPFIKKELKETLISPFCVWVVVLTFLISGLWEGLKTTQHMHLGLFPHNRDSGQ